MKKQLFRSFFIFVLGLVMTVSFAFGEDYDLIRLVREQTESAVPESAAELVQKDLVQATVNNVEITVREALYDGRTLYLSYSYRMPDVDHPLALTAAEAYGDELPEGIAADSYVYSLTDDAEELLSAHNVGWWMDSFWIDGKPLDDMPDGSGQYLTGTDVPGELIETDCWRLDNVGVFLEGKVQISLPIGDRQDYMDHSDGSLPDQGVVTFEFDAGDILSGVRVFRSDAEIALPEAAVSNLEAAFSPLMTYVTMDLAVNPDAYAAFVAENGQWLQDENGEPLWEYGPMDVFGAWLEQLQLTDGAGNILAPDNYGPSAYSDSMAEFLLPYLETIPDSLYLAPVNDEGVADLTMAIPVPVSGS